MIHLGSHLGKGMETGIENVSDAVAFALDRVKNTDILLENGAGYRNCVGSRFEEIGRIMDRIGSKRVGICLDTCHAYAGGYDISDGESVDRLAREIDSSVGLSRIGLFHLNDAKYPLGSGLDRHWHIGKGHIGKEGLSSFLRNKAFSSGSFIMELPEDGIASHADDMGEAMRIMGLLEDK